MIQVLADSTSNLVHWAIEFVVAGLIFWLLWWAWNAINPPEPFKKVGTVLLVVIAALWMINFLLSLTGHPVISY